LQRGLRRLLQHLHRELEHGLAIHAKQGATLNLAIVHMPRHAQDVAIAPVCMDIGRQNAWLIGGFQHHRARPVAKQDTGTPVVEIEDARKNFRSNYQGAARGTDLSMASATVRA
jgi:hypothetical protein